MKKKIIIIICIVVLISIPGYYIHKKNKSFDTNSTGTTYTAKVERGNLISAVSASGQIQSTNYLAVTTSVNGIVKKVYVKEGDMVLKGQKLMDITLTADGEESLTQAWASYLSAKIAKERAEKELYSLESAKLTAERDFEEEKENNSYQSDDERRSYKIAENSYITAVQNYNLQEKSIEAARVSLNKAWLTYSAQSPAITAPESGIISNIVVVEGMNISNSLSERTSSIVASIKKDGNPIASVNISEIDINKIKVGQQVSLTLSSISNKIFSGEVVGIDKIGGSSAGVANYPVIIKFKEPSDQILPNMGADAEIIIDQVFSVLYLPVSAVTFDNGSYFVSLSDVNDQKRTLVQVGIKTSDYIEIISGVNEGDEVVINALPTSGYTSDNNRVPTGGFFMTGQGGIPRR